MLALLFPFSFYAKQQLLLHLSLTAQLMIQVSIDFESFQMI
jgi:hypothetical protein